MRRFLPIVLVISGITLGATVFRAEVASAAQQALQVFITNSASDPVPVQQQGAVRTDRGQAFQKETFVSLHNGAAFVEVYTVPAGKRLEIEYVHVTFTYPNTDDKPYTSLYTSVGGAQVGWTLDMPTPAGAVSGFLAHQGSALVRIYADAGTQVRLWVNPDGPSVGGGIDISGRLFDAP